jgi:hypothetical protein
MSIKKITIAGIAGGVVYFLLGWLVYVILLKDFYAAHMNSCAMRPEADMIWWALIVANIMWGIFIAYIFNRWANITSFSAGLSAGAILFLLLGIAFGLGLYGYSTMYNDMTGLVVDILLGTVMGAIVGGVIGFVLGKVKD